MILSLDNNSKVCYKLKYNNKGVEKMFKKKEYTVYAVVHIVNGRCVGFIGLFKDIERAENCCDFWNIAAATDDKYEIHYILTDF